MGSEKKIFFSILLLNHFLKHVLVRMQKLLRMFGEDIFLWRKITKIWNKWNLRRAKNFP